MQTGSLDHAQAQQTTARTADASFASSSRTSVLYSHARAGGRGACRARLLPRFYLPMYACIAARVIYNYIYIYSSHRGSVVSRRQVN